jgi:NAD(P)H-nitrite reductase large subunit
MCSMLIRVDLQMTIDGKIKVKNGSAIKSFAEDMYRINFADGTTLTADLVIFATGLVFNSPCCV